MTASQYGDELNKAMHLTSANSINVARFLPQMFYYYHAYARMVQEGVAPEQIVVAVPSGNFGNICSALIAKRMGLPIKRFIAANNRNDVFLRYLNTGEYHSQCNGCRRTVKLRTYTRPLR